MHPISPACLHQTRQSTTSCSPGCRQNSAPMRWDFGDSLCVLAAWTPIFRAIVFRVAARCTPIHRGRTIEHRRYEEVAMRPDSPPFRLPASWRYRATRRARRNEATGHTTFAGVANTAVGGIEPTRGCAAVPTHCAGQANGAEIASAGAVMSPTALGGITVVPVRIIHHRPESSGHQLGRADSKASPVRGADAVPGPG